MRVASARGHSRPNAGKKPFVRGFTMLELMIVITMMMILMAVAVPLYKNHVIQAREAVLRQNLSTINRVIEAYRLDKRQSPQSLDDLVTAQYLPKLPADPMTGKADWTTDPEDPMNAVDPQQPGHWARPLLRRPRPRSTAKHTVPGERESLTKRAT